MRKQGVLILTALLVSAVSVCSLGEIAEQKFTNAKAESGRLLYVRALAAAKQEFSQKQVAALRAYSKELTLGRDAATRSGDLQTAVAIDSEIKSVNEAIADLQAGKNGPATPQLVITRARYGVPAKYLDVTARVRQCVHDDVIQGKDISAMVSALPDPAPGPDKKVVIEGTLGGKRFILEARQDVSFGKAPDQ